MTTAALQTYDMDTTCDEPMGIVRSNMLWAAGLGAVAIPYFDLTAVSLVNLKMVNGLTKHYEIPFSENLGKNLLAALFSGLSAKSLATGFVGSSLKAIPGLGTVFGLAAMPIFSAALTYAIGTVFVQHFESGGTLLDFDPKKTRGAFREAFEQGKEEAKKSVPASSPSAGRTAQPGKTAKA